MSFTGIIFFLSVLLVAAILVKPLRDTWSRHKRIANSYKDSQETES